MTDSLGNTLAAGQIVYCKSKEMVMRVAALIEPRLSGDDRSPAIVLEVIVPITGVRPGDPICLRDFMRVVDPASEMAIDRMLEGATKQ